MRIEYAGAIDRLINRGDRREPIFLDDQDRRTFLRTLHETCGKTGWQIRAYCLMANHFHRVAETPPPNLVVGMKWLLGTYTAHATRDRQPPGDGQRQLRVVLAGEVLNAIRHA